MKRALQIAFALCLCGVGFSGALTFAEIFGSTAVACPSPGAPGTLFGYPACVYGFLLFVILTIVTGTGLRLANGERAPRSQ
jgi:hypothetical protein